MMNAYSRLKRVLQQKQWSVPELHRRMRGRGYRVNVKSLYRLNDDIHPVERLDMRVASAICQVCAVPLSDWLVFEEDTNHFRTLTADKQARLNVLMVRNNAGALSPAERSELQTLVDEAEEITLANARLLVAQRSEPNSIQPLSNAS